MGLAQAGGVTYSNLAADETLVQVIAASVLLFNLNCYNPDAGDAAFVQFFDALAADVTLGSTDPKFVLSLPSGGGIDTANVLPKSFRTALTYAVTSQPMGTDAPSTECIVQLDYVGG